MKTLHLRKSISRSPLRLAFLPILIACFALSPAQALNPPPDGGYANGTTAEGTQSLFSLTTGVWNTALGFQALYHDTIGRNNTATGIRALFNDTSGSNNTATGVYALSKNTVGWYNSAMGAFALAQNTEGVANTANGYRALYYNSTGVSNTATGWDALYSNTGGSYNAAVGVNALFANSTGNGNTATGFVALNGNTTGSQNTAIGAVALYLNSAGSDNTAVGREALYYNTGSGNTAVGAHAGSGVTTASNVIAIGANVAGENVSNTCYIGNIFGVTSAGGTAVYVNSLGKLGTVVSSQRFKDEIKPMDKASEAILALKPVTFRYKQEIDPVRRPQFGLVAEDVEKVNADLVVRDTKGEVYTVRYEAVNAMLLNEFLKEHRKMQELEATVAHQQKQIETLTAGLQKVSAQLEVSKAAPQTVLNNQ